MSTTIKFKRGTSYQVNNYTSAEIAEPVFDYESGRLFISLGEGQDLIPVDQRVYLQGFEGYEEVSYGTTSSTLIESGEPSTDSDATPGTIYVNSDTGVPYLLTSNSDDGNATWTTINISVNTTTNPTASDGDHSPGAIWVNEDSGEAFIYLGEESYGSSWTSFASAVSGSDTHTDTSNPTVNDDTYSIGTIWVNTSTDTFFICVDNSSGAAVWSQGSGSSSAVTDTSDPSSTDDSYDVGTIWINTSADTYFVCTDNTSSNAVWVSTASSPSGVHTATGDPGVSDDSYAVGTIWVNTSTDAYFVCTDDSAGAAVWVSTASSPAGVQTSTSDPTPSDDGHNVGVIWVNTSTDKYWVCVDNTASNAVWKESGSSADILPEQSGHTGEYLRTNGTSVYWNAVSGSGETTDAPAYISKRPKDISLDDIDTGTTLNSVFSMFQTIDFSASSDGSIWFAYEIPEYFDGSEDITFRLVYSLNGSDSSKNVYWQTKYWAVGDGELPGLASPTSTAQESVGSDTSQGVKRKYELSDPVSSADISANDTIAVKMTRLAANVGDTYTGKLQLLAVEAYWTPTASSSTGFPYVDVRPDDMHTDDTITAVSESDAYDIFKTYDFDASDDGAIWFAFEVSSEFDASSDINFRLIYNLEGSDSSKNVIWKTEYWTVSDGGSPNIASPDNSVEDTISSDTSQGVKRKTALTYGLISASDISANNTVAVRMSRLGSDGSDTYTGTFQLIAIEVYQ